VLACVGVDLQIGCDGIVWEGNNRKTMSYEYSMMWRPEHLSGGIYSRITKTKY